MLEWIVARLRERSTWIGLTGLLTALGVGLEPEQAESIVVLGLSAGSAIYAFTKDRLPPSDPR